jgi:ABC-type nitrate/sulfonate/bicarbonate transport system ATPase subunit
MVEKMIGGHIKIDCVSKKFTNLLGEENPAVNQVSLDIKPGEFVCLMGPSGCGKTTLLRIIAGLLRPDEGELFLDDKPINGPGCERGLVFQNPELFQWMNVEQNVAFGLKARKVYAQQKEEVQKYIDMVGLNGFEKALPHHLSGGMQQRAAFARALINRPKVLLLDEPFGALDAFTRVALQERLIDLWKTFGYTAVMVTHDAEEAVALATQIIVMSDRPATVEEIFCNDLAYPRDRDSSELIGMKKDILNVLHLKNEL